MDLPLGRLTLFENPVVAGKPGQAWWRHDVSRCKRDMFDKFIARDVDKDGDMDLVSSRGNSASYDGVFWLEQVRTDLPVRRFIPARVKENEEVPLPFSQSPSRTP